MDEKLIAKLKTEIETDIDGRYEGKTAKELVSLINDSYVKVTEEQVEVPVEVVVAKETKTITRSEKKDAPVFRVIMGIAGAPNMVTEEDIAEALK